jgi:hypothetical protein
VEPPAASRTLGGRGAAPGGNLERVAGDGRREPDLLNAPTPRSVHDADREKMFARLAELPTVAGYLEVRALTRLLEATVTDTVEASTGAARNRVGLAADAPDLTATLLIELKGTLGASSSVGSNFWGGGAYTDGVHSDVLSLWAGSRGVAAPAGPFSLALR